MYHILKRVDYGERTYSVYHSSSTHTLEEAQIILDELNKINDTAAVNANNVDNHSH